MEAFLPGRCLAGVATATLASDVPQAFLHFARATRFQQACMQLIAWTLPSEERRLLRGTFLKMDSRYTGAIQFSQLNQFLEENFCMTKADCAAVCEALTV